MPPNWSARIDRAVGYTESVLAYGKAQEAPPARRKIKLHMLVEDVHGLLELQPLSGIEFENEVPPDLVVDADAEQLFRVLTNLARNAIQAMSADSDDALVRRICISASRDGSVSRILVADTGPGLPRKARENLFAAFRGSARSGGTGLGLAIAHELVRAHGGQLQLLESTGAAALSSRSPFPTSRCVLMKPVTPCAARLENTVQNDSKNRFTHACNLQHGSLGSSSRPGDTNRRCHSGHIQYRPKSARSSAG